MATIVSMPRQGQSVESCIITAWKKSEGEAVRQGEELLEIETDKAVMTIDCPASGMLLKRFFDEGADVPVLTAIAVIGEAGEDLDQLASELTEIPMAVQAGSLELSGYEADTALNDLLSPSKSGNLASTSARHHQASANLPPIEKSGEAIQSQQNARLDVSSIFQGEVNDTGTPPHNQSLPTAQQPFISPRAQALATENGLPLTDLNGTGPNGRIIERDVQAVLHARSPRTRLARAVSNSMEYQIPAHGSGIGGRVTAHDLTTTPAPSQIQPAVQDPSTDAPTIRPLEGVRKTIATRMVTSLQSTAQLTLNASADATTLLAYRKRLKESDAGLALSNITINDLILLVVSQTLKQFPNLNAHLQNNEIRQYTQVHLGFAVDTPRGLLVPIIRNAQALSLRQISNESQRLSQACISGTIMPDDLNGGTFTVTNLGHLGIESFTPVLNTPQVAILGIGNVNLKPIETDGEVHFVSHMSLSLTIDHQAVDGAPAAHFLQAVTQGIANIDLILAG